MTVNFPDIAQRFLLPSVGCRDYHHVVVVFELGDLPGRTWGEAPVESDCSALRRDVFPSQQFGNRHVLARQLGNIIVQSDVHFHVS